MFSFFFTYSYIFYVVIVGGKETGQSTVLFEFIEVLCLVNNCLLKYYVIQHWNCLELVLRNKINKSFERN